MTSTGLHQKSIKSGLRPPCFSRRTGGSGHAQCRGQSAPPRYDAKPAPFALNQGSRKLCSGGVTCPGLIRCTGLEQRHHPQNEQNRSSTLGPLDLNPMHILRSVFTSRITAV